MKRFFASDFWYYFKRDKVAIASFAVFCLLILAAVFAPWLAQDNPYDLASIDIMDSELPPMWIEGGESRFWLGTDEQGRGIYSTILYGLRTSLLIGIGAVLLQMAIGIIVGLLAAWYGGWLDNVLMHPSAEIEREYWVRVAGDVSEETLQALRQGVELEDGMAHFDEITPLMVMHDDDTQYNRYYSVVLKEGRNREVRRLWEAVGCQVSRLKRIRFGTISLPKELAAGRFRELSVGETAQLLALLRKKPQREKTPPTPR